MSEMPKEQKEYYLDIGNKHANFLTEKVFKPAFMMAFIHGIKHGREDATKEMNAKLALHFNKEKMKDQLNAEVTQVTFGIKPVQKRCKRKKK